MLRRIVGAAAQLLLLAPAVSVLLVVGCVSPPSPGAVLATGFGSPEQTFATFQTALRGNLVDLEYRCLSADFKAHHRISLQTYHEARAQLAHDVPLFRLAARGRVIEQMGMPIHGSMQLLIRVDAVVATRAFLVNMVREGFYQTYDGRGVIEGALARWRDIATQQGDQLQISIPMPEGFTLDEIGELHAGRQWKIDGFEPIDLP